MAQIVPSMVKPNEGHIDRTLLFYRNKSMLQLSKSDPGQKSLLYGSWNLRRNSLQFPQIFVSDVYWINIAYIYPIGIM